MSPILKNSSVSSVSAPSSPQMPIHFPHLCAFSAAIRIMRRIALCLGYRAIRICLKQPDIFKTQLRALLRAAMFGNLSIMYPMITSTEEVKKTYESCEGLPCDADYRNHQASHSACRSQAYVHLISELTSRWIISISGRKTIRLWDTGQSVSV